MKNWVFYPIWSSKLGVFITPMDYSDDEHIIQLNSDGFFELTSTEELEGVQCLRDNHRAFVGLLRYCK